MNITDFIKQSWQVHNKEAAKIFSEISTQLRFAKTDEEIAALINLCSHLVIEHLGNWQEGLNLIDDFFSNEHLMDKRDLLRFQAILKLCLNEITGIDDFSLSDQARIYAATASALSDNFNRARTYLDEADRIAHTELASDDPAQKALAITCNNLATSLEVQLSRSVDETALMIKAASLARYYWEIAGTWLNVERAEYRLSHSHLKAGNISRAHIHAVKCLEIIEKNDPQDLELFFAYEVLILSCQDLTWKQKYQSKITEVYLRLKLEDQAWCKECLDKVKN